MSKKAETVKLANFEEVPPDQLEAAELMKHQEMIYEASREVDETENALRIATDKVTSAKEREKGAKADHDDAVAALQQTIRNCRANKHLDLPLFAGPKLTEAEPVPEPDDDAWRSQPLAVIDGLKSKTIQALGDADIETLGQLADYSNSGRLIGDIKGIGPAAVEEITGATDAYWADRKAAAEDAKAIEVASILAVEIKVVLEFADYHDDQKTSDEIEADVAADLESAGIETVGDVIDFFATAEQAQNGETIRDIGFIADAQAETLRVALIAWRKARGKVAMELLPDRWLAPFDDVAAIAKGDPEVTQEEYAEAVATVRAEPQPGDGADPSWDYEADERKDSDPVGDLLAQYPEGTRLPASEGYSLHPESTGKKRKSRANKAPSGSV